MPSQATVDRPGRPVRFTITDDALTMVSTLGGHLHAALGGEGCRAISFTFSTSEPRKALTCTLDVPAELDEIDWESTEWTEERLAALAERVPLADCRLTVAHDLVPWLDGAVLDFGDYLRMERFVWSSLAGDDDRETRRCTCLRTMGAPRGKRATCLDDARQGLV